MERTFDRTLCGLATAWILTAAATATAQGGDRAAPLRLGVLPIHTGEPDPILGEYGTWAATGSYKVSFHGDMTFIPYLGESYPRNQPLSWRTESVTIGGRELMMEGAVAERYHTDTRYEYRFGAVTEAYDVREDGLEQTFVIHQRPAGGGDLVVVGRIDSALHGARLECAHGAIVFRDDEGQDILRYGEAWAVDATDRVADVLTSHDGDRITLTVPEAWLEDASYPVVIDPLVTTTKLRQGEHTSSVDVVRVDEFDLRFVVYCLASSQADHDVLGGVYHDDWTAANLSGGSFYLDVGSWDTPRVRCATVDSPSKLCLVYNREDLNNGDSHLVFHVRDGGDTTTHVPLDVFTLTPPAARHDWRASIGGLSDPSQSGSGQFAVTFQREISGAFLTNTIDSQVYAAIIDVSGASPTIGPRFRIPSVGSGSIDQERPSINHAERPASGVPTWIVTWQEFDNGPAIDDWDVYAVQIDGNGNVGSTVLSSLNEGNGNHKLAPKVDGRAGRYCLLYPEAPLALVPNKTSGPGGMNITTERFDWEDGSATIVQLPTTSLGPPGVLDPRFIGGDIAFDPETRSHWALTFVSDRAFGGAGDGAVHVVRLGYQGKETEHLRAGIPATATQSGLPGGVSYDADNDEFLVGWAMSDPTQFIGVGEPWVSTLTYTQPVPWSLAGSGCSLATIALTGNQPQQIGNEFTTVEVTGAQANASHFLVLGLVPINQAINNPVVTAGCRLLVPLGGMFGHLWLSPAQVGSDVSWTFALPEGVIPGTVYFQDWIFNPNLAKLFSTQRLEVPLVK